jgi:hypothetical protein
MVNDGDRDQSHVDPEGIGAIVVRIVVEDDATAAALLAELDELASEGVGTIVNRP